MKRLLLILFLLPGYLGAQEQRPAFRTGAEMLMGTNRYDWPTLQVGVVANHSSMVGSTHLVDTLLRKGAHIRTLFCPEHGFRGTAEAGALIDNSVDPLTGIPIISLYGNNKKPTSEQMEGLDLVIFDLQDVGCRFYTYISTLHYVMQACAENDVPLLLLDRPNPNGHYVDGPVLEAAYRSFVGMHPGVPVVYGMTILEYALMINGEGWLGDSLRCALTGCEMEGYSHDSAFCRSIVLPVHPSPNLRNAQAIALYPSLCFFEGTRISVGRGTPHPFEIIGNNYQRDLRREQVPSRLNLEYLIDMYRHTAPGKFFNNNNFFEKLAGTGTLRQQLLRGASEQEIRASWEEGLDAFRQVRQRYLLYPEK